MIGGFSLCGPDRDVAITWMSWYRSELSIETGAVGTTGAGRGGAMIGLSGRAIWGRGCGMC